MSDQWLTAEELDTMTKDELLTYGQSLGLSPMNASMAKDEIRAAIDAYSGEGAGEAQAGGEEVVDPRVTTTRTKDFLNRALVNATPGTSQATDYLGRSVVATDKDHLGRALVP